MTSKATHYFLSPMPQKKRAVSSEMQRENSYRVISEQAVDMHPPYAPLKLPDLPQNNVIGQRWSTDDFRRNRPNENTVCFLHHNARTLNEPLNCVAKETEANWMTWRRDDPIIQPAFARSSTNRIDYEWRPLAEPLYRHKETNNAKGIVPVTLVPHEPGKQRFWKERFSFEHHPDARRDPPLPCKGRRQGALVWDPMTPEQLAKYPEAGVIPQGYFGSGWPSQIKSPKRKSRSSISSTLQSPTQQVPVIVPLASEPSDQTKTACPPASANQNGAGISHDLARDQSEAVMPPAEPEGRDESQVKSGSSSPVKRSRAPSSSSQPAPHIPPYLVAL